MKKSNKSEDNKGSLRPDLPYSGTDKGIRHVEDAASFLNEAADLNGEYGRAEDMYDMWGLGRRDSTVQIKSHKILIRFIAAILVTAIIIASVFVILPKTLPELFRGTNIELFVQKEVNLMYDDSYRVVNVTATNVLTRPDNTSARITQVLYNEPVQVIDDSDAEYTKIRTEDGIEGYVRAADLIDDTSSVEPDLHEYMLVISDTSKNVMTHASQGTLITQVMMNTVLYSDIKRDGVYQVSLPGGETGWVGSSGVIEIEPRSSIEVVSSRYFVSSALSLVNATYFENGITKQGISVNGLVYVCSCVNGIVMPRTLEEQMEAGVSVPLEYDAVTGDLMIESIIPGDLVFLRSPTGIGEYDEAICTDTGTLIMRSEAGTTIRLRNFTADSDIASRIVSVRRVFSD
ncbi:MAG: SH3 domain-containing protein [Clostridiales bacterium]|nr:SH3 domain-containing protein [Clostridiales bacterium]MBP3809886.1 SH3 domain-containing protein [Clostridiales bacterium]